MGMKRKKDKDKKSKKKDSMLIFFFLQYKLFSSCDFVLVPVFRA